MITRETISHHIINDRIDRVVFIATKIGYGEVVVEDLSDHSDAVCQLTSTGVMIIRSMDKSKVITLWLASIDQATAMYKGRRMPTYLYNKVLKNRKYKEFMQKILDKLPEVCYTKIKKELLL